MGAVAAHHLLGKPGDGNLILLAGPNYERMTQLVSDSGIASMRFSEVNGLDALKTRVDLSRTSVIVIAPLHEVEGLLDRSAFDGRLTDLAYSADRVVYAGSNGAVLVHPASPGTTMEVRGGRLAVRQRLDEVEAGHTVTGLTVDRL